MKVKKFEINKEIFIKKIIDQPHKNVIENYYSLDRKWER